MAVEIQIKRSSGTTKPNTLKLGELAYTYGAGSQGNNGDRLFIGEGGVGGDGNANAVTVIGGQYFSDKLDHVDGTLTANSAITTDSSNKVDTIKLKGVDDNTTGNIVLDNEDSTNATTLKGGNVGSNINITLPTTAGTVIATGNLTDITGTIGTLTSLSVGNITTTGNTISTTAGGDLILDPQGSNDIDANSHKIINVTDPTGAQDAATKAYVDATVNGLDVKGSVKAATTGNASFTGAFRNGDTLDGVSLSTGDRILIKDQTTGSQNGIYTVNASGAPTRATDFDSSSDASPGSFVFVEQGTTNGDNGFVLTNNSVTLGSTALVFVQFSGAGQITAGTGLTKDGNTINAVVGDGLDVAADEITVDLKANGGLVIESTEIAVDLGASSITGTLGVADGGTGLTSISKGSILVANTANTITALDGGGSSDGLLLYTQSSDTLSFSNAIDGGEF